MALTEVRIRALKPKAARYSVTDERGLVLEVLPSGVLAWRYRYRLAGKAEKVALGQYPALSLKDARRKRDELAVLVARGESPAERKRRMRSDLPESVTVAQFAEKFYRETVMRDRKNPKDVRRYIDREILPAIGSKAVASVTTEDVRALVWRKKDHGFDAAAGALRGLLKRMFDYATTCGLVTVNPCAGLPMRHVFKARSRERSLAPDELRVFLTTVNESNMRKQFRAFFHLVVLTLCRKRELLTARWEDVDLRAAEWHVPALASKTGKPHVVYLSSQAVALFEKLHELAGGSDLVLPGRLSLGRPFADSAPNVALREAMSGSSVPAFTIHDLRRTASTLLHENGWPADVIEKALNHTIGGVRGVYNRAEYAEQRREMLQAWADFVDGLLTEGRVLPGRFRREA